MKTTFCLLAGILMAAGTRAQESTHSSSSNGGFYIKGGLNLANISTTTSGRIDNANMLASFHVGFMGDCPIGDIVAIQPGLLFTGKGAKSQTGNPGDAYYYKATSNPYYIEIPVNVVIKLPLGDKESHFFFGAGPYAAIGIAGKNKTDGNVGAVHFSSSDNIQFSNDDPTTFNQQEGAGLGKMRRFDFGINGTAGFELHGLLLSANYGWGLTKINSVEKNDDDKNKHRVLSISVGFKL
ncbi:MAG: PorT family protein [Bacteroidetes bacterium]|nr:PorT family protein [Bacteroidota bacterium]